MELKDLDLISKGLTHDNYKHIARKSTFKDGIGIAYCGFKGPKRPPSNRPLCPTCKMKSESRGKKIE